LAAEREEGYQDIGYQEARGQAATRNKDEVDKFTAEEGKAPDCEPFLLVLGKLEVADAEIITEG
jgi:hypothetical protein